MKKKKLTAGYKKAFATCRGDKDCLQEGFVCAAEKAADMSDDELEAFSQIAYAQRVARNEKIKGHRRQDKEYRHRYDVELVESLGNFIPPNEAVFAKEFAEKLFEGIDNSALTSDEVHALAKSLARSDRKHQVARIFEEYAEAFPHDESGIVTQITEKLESFSVEEIETTMSAKERKDLSRGRNKLNVRLKFVKILVSLVTSSSLLYALMAVAKACSLTT